MINQRLKNNRLVFISSITIIDVDMWEMNFVYKTPTGSVHLCTFLLPKFPLNSHKSKNSSELFSAAR